MSLLLEMARGAVLAKVAQRVSRLSRGYVEGWIAGDFSLVDRVAQRHENEIRAWKEVVLRTISSISVDDLLQTCKDARPDLTDLWESETARNRLTEEWNNAHAYVEKL